MKVWVIRKGAINAEILDVMTSDDDQDSTAVIKKWRTGWVGGVAMKNYAPDAIAVECLHAGTSNS